MKRFLLYILGSLVALSSSAVDFQDAQANGPAEFTSEYKGLTLKYVVTSTNPAMAAVSGFVRDNADYDPDLGVPLKSLAIPSKVAYENSDYEVTAISSYALANWKAIESVDIPASVTEIKDNAFRNCSNLKYAILSRNLSEISAGTFWGCSSLKVITMPESLARISEYAFKDCSSLPEISIPKNVAFIGRDAFEGCTSLEAARFESVESMLAIDFQSNPLEYAHKLYIHGIYADNLYIPENVAEIGPNTFRGGDFKSVAFPMSVTAIGENAFRSCPNLTSLSIPNSVKYVGDGSFYNCPIESLTLEEGISEIEFGLQALSAGKIKSLYIGRPHSSKILRGNANLESLAIGNCVTEVLDNEFADMASLRSLALGSGLRSIGEHAFDGCPALRSVVFPPAMQVIKNGAFANSGIEEIVFGPEINTIQSRAFAGCPVRSVSITASNIPAVGEDVFDSFGWTLLVGSEQDKSKYESSDNFWNRLSIGILKGQSFLRYDGPSEIHGWAEDIFNLSATVRPDDASLPYVFWSSTNPDVATVTLDGTVVLQPGLETEEGHKPNYITVRSLYQDSREIMVKVAYGSFNGIEEVETDDAPMDAIDWSEPFSVYGLDGSLAGKSSDGLPKGIYIIRQGAAARKILVR